MRQILTCLAVIAMTASVARAEGDTRPVLVELFTSQGCSSCPPADEFAGQLAERDDVVVLSFHVNYWDYIGWEDPFATEQTTARQYAYAHALAQRNVYTPEMVIGGVVHRVGSDEAAVNRMIERVRELAAPAPEFGVRLVDHATVRVEVGAGEAPEQPAEVLLVTYAPQRLTAVARGENTGRRLANYNVVKELHHIGQWTGSPVAIDLAWDSVFPNDGNDGCAIIIQAPDSGPVLAVIDLDMDTLQ